MSNRDIVRTGRMNVKGGREVPKEGSCELIEGFWEKEWEGRVV